MRVQKQFFKKKVIHVKNSTRNCSSSAPQTHFQPRHFVGLVPSQEVLDYLAELQKKLQTNEFYTSQIRWTPVNNLHFTLKFFGDSLANPEGKKKYRVLTINKIIHNCNDY